MELTNTSKSSLCESAPTSHSSTNSHRNRFTFIGGWCFCCPGNWDGRIFWTSIQCSWWIWKVSWTETRNQDTLRQSASQAAVLVPCGFKMGWAWGSPDSLIGDDPAFRSSFGTLQWSRRLQHLNRLHYLPPSCISWLGPGVFLSAWQGDQNMWLLGGSDHAMNPSCTLLCRCVYIQGRKPTENLRSLVTQVLCIQPTAQGDVPFAGLGTVF